MYLVSIPRVCTFIVIVSRCRVMYKAASIVVITLHVHISTVEPIAFALVPQLRTASPMVNEPITDLRHANTRCLKSC